MDRLDVDCDTACFDVATGSLLFDGGCEVTTLQSTWAVHVQRTEASAALETLFTMTSESNGMGR